MKNIKQNIIPELVSGSSTQVVAVHNKARHSRGFLSGIFNAGSYNNRNNTLINRCVEDAETSSAIILNDITTKATTCVEDPRYRHSGMTAYFKEEALNKGSFRAPLRSGFTLIELLVVVLIIGILAAVALPQYQKAVLKASMTRAIPAVHALKQAEELYYLSSGTYTNNAVGTKLDIQDIEGCTPTDQEQRDVFICKGFFINIYTAGKPGKTIHTILAGIGDKSWRELGYLVYLDHTTYPNRRECLAYQENNMANEVCKSMGGILDYTFNAPVSFFRTPYNAYVLP